ncbi:GumC family protein [Pseudoflavitalea rhizosphaerae]|uniref:GumC family protein n=1 Tax=Pseudoflavitalea rhizosphaerae TaxID=1884793 RepID=UPI000F8CC81E|nr:polysaccharide biosynthesis tyrosine autokinase [Pseudoflavitalea rhizosphaerae]
MEPENIAIKASKSGESGQTVNLKEILIKYFHYTPLFVIVLAIAIFAAWLHLRYTTPKYNVGSTLLIRNDNANRGGGSGDDMFADIALFQSNTNKQNEIEILRSRNMMERVVRSLGLEKSYSVVGKIKAPNIYQEHPFDVLILNLKDSSRSFSLPVHIIDYKKFRIGEKSTEYFFGQQIELPEGTIKLVPRESTYSRLSFRDFLFQWIPTKAAAGLYGGGLAIKPANDQSNVLSITYLTDNPRLGADIVNQLMVEYNDAGVEDKNEINRRIITFIDDRLRIVEKQLDSVEVDLQNFKSNQEVIDLAAQSTLFFGNIGELEKGIQEQQLYLQVSNLLESYIKDSTKKHALVPTTLGLPDLNLQELATEYNALVVKRQQELQTGATVNNPVIQGIDSEIENARVKLGASLRNISGMYRANLEMLENKKLGMKKEVSAIPEKERMNNERARQQAIKQNLYLYLLQKKEESAIAKASTIANSRVIDNAMPVYNQVSPIPLRIYGIALLAGLLIPIAIIYILDMLNDKVTTRSDITKMTAAPIIGEIGHNEGGKVLLFPQQNRAVVTEQFRILRTNLRFVLGEKFESPVLLVTSSFSGEGKSFVSTNLGATLAVSGKRTVILEFDLRKPKIIEGLGLPKATGLTNYLVGSAELNQLPQAVPQVENLFVIPCGPVPPNPSEILLTPRIEELFVWLRENFEAIVIDTAPVGLVGDALTLSRYADCGIYVIRQRYTFKKQLGFIDDLYQQKKLPRLGLLVNDVVTGGAQGYYGYGGGSYGYGYGYGYGSEKYYESKRRGVKGFIGRIFGRK